MRRVVLALAIAGCSGGTALAGWELFGRVGLSAGRTDNPSFLGGCNPNYKPTHKRCTDSDPNNDDLRCDPEIAGEEQLSDVTGNLEVTAGVLGTWDSTKFDLSYSPSFFIYQEAEIDQLGHSLLANWSHEYSTRSTLQLSNDFDYTPEQDIDPNSLNRNSLLLVRTTRVSNEFKGTHDLRTGRHSMLITSYRHSFRAHTVDRFIDTSNHHAGLKFRGEIGSRNTISVGYEYGIFTFGDGVSPLDPNASDPNAPFDPTSETPLDTRRHQVFVGYSYIAARSPSVTPDTKPRLGRPLREPRGGFIVDLELGAQRLEPEEGGFEERNALYANAALSWYGDKTATALGYSRGLTDGGGAFANAESQTTYSSFRFRLNPEWSAEIAGAYNVHERVDYTSAGFRGDETVRSLSGRAGVNYEISMHWAAFGTYTYHRQEIRGDVCSVPPFSVIPETSGSRYLLGISWSSF